MLTCQPRGGPCVFSTWMGVGNVQDAPLNAILGGPEMDEANAIIRRGRISTSPAVVAPTAPADRTTTAAAVAATKASALRASLVVRAPRGTDRHMDTDLLGSAIQPVIREHTGPVAEIRRTAHGASSDLTAIVECENGPFFIKAVRNRPGGRRDSLIRERATCS